MNANLIRSDSRALGVLLLGAVCLSFAPLFVKVLNPLGMGPTSIGFWRTFIGAMILFVWTIITRQKLLLPWSVMRWTIAAGFVFFLDLYCWHKSILYSGAGISTILANTQVFATAVLSFFVFKERIRPRFVIAAVTAIIGVILLIGVGSDVEFTTIYIKGTILGLLTGLAYAHYLIVLKLAGHERQSPVGGGSGFMCLMAWTSLSSAFFLGLTTLVDKSEAMLPPNLQALLYVALLALIVQAVGWWLISRSLPEIAASHSGLGLLLQPVLATFWGVIFFSEHFGQFQIIGAVVTLAAIYVGSVRKGGEADSSHKKRAADRQPPLK
ncbi:MAG: hypothetical protein DRP47_08525 [Candidatus Zixiibacteriota bacterium]|nr:MAG: hypothetical protein DRP47_08525 [candidate division Zixibacteria bacterium]